MRRSRLPFIIILIFAALLTRSLASLELPLPTSAFDGVIHQRKGQGGKKAAERLVATSLAGRHFDAHGPKWPSRAFVDAVKEATMQVAPDHADNRPPPHGGGGSIPHGSGASAPSLPLPRPVLLMAMANDVALQRTVPMFVQSLFAVRTVTAASDAPATAGQESTLPTSTAPAAAASAAVAGLGGSLADHLVLMCSSERAVELCRDLGVGSRWEGLRGLDRAPRKFLREAARK